MPFNDFADYPMSFQPDRAQLHRPLHRAIADLLEREILSGALPPHTKLPPQRELADYLDINLSTVTKGYELCKRKGLLYASVGRGTFVAPQSRPAQEELSGEPPEGRIEMSVIEPYSAFNGRVLQAARAVLADARAERLFAYSFPLGSPGQREAAADWLHRFGVVESPEQVIITTGTQSGIVAALISLFEAGDQLAADPHTYPNFIELAKLLQLRLLPVVGDEFGMRPEALEELCRTHSPRGIYLMPSCSNPTALSMPEARRRQLAEVIERYGLILIEDDAYSFLDPVLIPPMAAAIPGRTIYINGVSTSICGGLRIALMTAPAALRQPLVGGLHNTNLKTSSLNTEIAAELMRDGGALEIIRQKAERSALRNRIFDEVFGEQGRAQHPAPFFRWLRLPARMERLGHHEVEHLADEAGVRLFHADRFRLPGAEPVAAVRVALSSVRTEGELRRGLLILKNLFQAREPEGYTFIV
ncbi:MAG: PLP-dependent aminotransferase family protein [Clostridiales bacterium]|nr:PLP-dependent aminotransferase family protein [Clostridiales bacterium]